MLQPLPQGPGQLRLDEPRLGASAPGSPTSSTTTTDVLQGFGTDSVELTSDHEAILQRVAADLNAQPLRFGGFVTVVGSADRRGIDEYNRDLGQRRADAVHARLRDLVTDDATRSEIRAYSLGEPQEGPLGDVPEFRKVTITITRRSYDIRPLAPAPGPTLQIPPPVDINLPPQLQFRPTFPQPRPALPAWFWRPLRAAPVPAPFLNQLSRWITGRIGRGDIAQIAAELAGGLGFDKETVQRSLDEAMVSGGEEGLKALLRAMIEALAGPPTSRPERPFGPVTPELPRPPVITSPPLPLPF
jgi:outer membrane protein OmpA-like peptidoglycan-associated protein